MVSHNYFKLGLFLLFYITCTLTINYLFTDQHERAHAQISYLHGCENISIEISFLGLKGSTMCVDKNLSYHYPAQRIYLDSMNEIIGYNVAVLIFAVLASAFIVGMAILLNGDS